MPAIRFRAREWKKTGMTYSWENPSRRRLLRGSASAAAAVLVGIPALSGPASAFGPPPGQSWADWAEANTPRKSTQRDAEYHVASSGGKRCANCANFRAPNRCAVVEGTNGPEGVCRLHYGAAAVRWFRLVASSRPSEARAGIVSGKAPRSENGPGSRTFGACPGRRPRIRVIPAERSESRDRLQEKAPVLRTVPGRARLTRLPGTTSVSHPTGARGSIAKPSFTAARLSSANFGGVSSHTASSSESLPHTPDSVASAPSAMMLAMRGRADGGRALR